MAALRAARTVEAAAPAPAKKRAERKAQPAEKVTPLAECLDTFWATSDELNNLRFTIVAPSVDAAPVKRLGEPSFWQGRPGLLPQMETAYRTITEAALALTLGD